MSDFRAIAAVTAALQQLLQGAVGADVPGAKVSTDRPDIRQNSTAGGVGLNIYLYQVTPDPALRNSDLPARTSSGKLVRRPQAALTLHYLFSCYGEDSELEPQRVLGSAVRTLHARPLITKALLQAVRDAATDDNEPLYPELADIDLDQQIDLVRLAPLGLNLEELSKLWSVFFQVPYTLSVAYEASVVLIEEPATPADGQPVVAPELTVGLRNQPRITGVGKADSTPVKAGDNIIVRGERLSGEALAVQVGGQPASPQTIAPDYLTVDLSTVDDLRPGPVAVRLTYGPLQESSNVVRFILHPTVTNVDIAGGNLTITTDLTVGARQRAAVALFDPDTAERLRVLSVPERDADTETLTVGVADVDPATYRVRLLVDGAESQPNGPVVAL